MNIISTAGQKGKVNESVMSPVNLRSVVSQKA